MRNWNSAGTAESSEAWDEEAPVAAVAAVIFLPVEGDFSNKLLQVDWKSILFEWVEEEAERLLVSLLLWAFVSTLAEPSSASLSSSDHSLSRGRVSWPYLLITNISTILEGALKNIGAADDV